MTARPVRSISARRAARHPKVAYLVAADETTMPELELLIATMPLCATGRIFIEVADAASVGEIAAPPRMTVTWLDRSRGDRAPGQALAGAVTAWADEMLCDAEDATGVYLLAAAGAERIQRHLTIGLEVSPSRVHVG